MKIMARPLFCVWIGLPNSTKGLYAVWFFRFAKNFDALKERHKAVFDCGELGAIKNAYKLSKSAAVRAHDLNIVFSICV